MAASSRNLYATLAVVSLVTVLLAALLALSGPDIKPDRRSSFQFDEPAVPNASR